MDTQSIGECNGIDVEIVNGDPAFYIFEATRSELSFECLWPAILRQLGDGTYQEADLIRFAGSAPVVLEALRSGLVNTICHGFVYDSPARRRRVLSNAARFRPLVGFTVADQHDPDEEGANACLLRALNDHVRDADAPALVALAEAVLAGWEV